MKRIVYILISILLTIMIAYGFNVSLSGFKAITLGLVIYVLVNFLVEKVDKLNANTLLNSLLFAFFMEIGICYEKGGSINYIWDSLSHIFYFVLTIVSFTFLFYIVINYIKIVLNHNFKDKKISNKLLKYFDNHPFLCTFGLALFISWVYLIFYFPGSMAYDGMWQLDFYYGDLAFSNHHQASLTYVMGFLMDVGKYFGSDNLGMFLFILMQIFVNVLVYAYVILMMKKMNVPFKWRLISLLFYALFPLLCINSITYIKDTLFYLIFLFTIVFVYYHFFFEYKKNNYIKYVVLLICLLCLYLIRNTGFYIALISLLFLGIYVFIKDKRAGIILGSIFLAILGFNIFYNEIFLDKLEIKKASVREMLSIPFQQTGRYLKEYNYDLTKEEVDILNNIFSEDYYKMGNFYNPNIADGIKMKFKEYPSNEELKDYFKIWFNMGLRHPGVYIDATLNNIYGYFYPCDKNFLNEMLGFYDIKVDGKVVNTDNYDFKRNNLKWGRDALYKISETMEDTFAVSLLYRPAFYTWTLLIASFYVWEKNYKRLLIYFVPLYVVLMLCLVSPVNGHMRYMQPIMVSCPFIVGIILSLNKKSKNA